MTISQARFKVSFTEEEKKAINIVMDICDRAQAKDFMGFLSAFANGDWIYYDDDDVAFEFEDNISKDYDPI